MRAVALLCLALSSSSWADECDQLPAPSVKVKRLDEPVTFNSNYSYHALTAMGESLARPGRLILGLTHGEAIIQFETQFPAYIDRTGRWECASPQLTLTYGFNPMAVYVAQEFPEGSCGHKEIHDHELRHVKTYQQHIAGIEKELADTLQRRFATGKPWRGPIGQTQGKFQQELDERWIPYVNRVMNRVKLAQALIDTDAEYERVANACNGEIRKRIR